MVGTGAREVIEAKFAAGVTDLNLNQAAGLMMLMADVKKLFAFVKQIETTDDPEKMAGVSLFSRRFLL